MVDKVFDMYKHVNLGNNEICKKCKDLHKRANLELYPPASLWNVGDKFETDQYKVMFVGKPARGSPGEDTGYGFLDCRKCGAELYNGVGWPYWNYTKEISKRLYGSAEEGWNRIAFSNIIKCNNSVDIDTATYDMKKHCIDELRVIWKEIEILQPKNVVFSTHWYYDDFIDKFIIGDKYKDITDRNHRIPNGKKKISWWHREFYKDGQLIMRILRTAHPERQQKEGFVSKIVEWIKA
jgi:hypothetical protein